MRPCFMLALVALMSAQALSQQPSAQRAEAPYNYGFGPYIPLLTTPEISLEQVSPNPVGATNATAGLAAGATDSTLSQVQGSTRSVYTVPVWYQGGGAPITSPTVRLYPGRVGPEDRMMREQNPRQKAAHEKAPPTWAYFSGHDQVATRGPMPKGKKSDHVYTNDDIAHENEKNGDVKYDHKSEKI